jgi:CheY-like chemotaxis protein
MVAALRASACAGAIAPDPHASYCLGGLVKGIGVPRGILIVDDEPAITETLSMIFEKHGYEVRCAHSAEAAIESIAVWEPDLAILDVMLPCMNGIDLALVLKANRPGCHVVLFSGQQGTQALLEEAAKRGNMFEFLAKPVHPLFVLDFVSSLLADAPKGTT